MPHYVFGPHSCLWLFCLTLLCHKDITNIGKTVSVKESNIDAYNFLLELCKRHPSADEKLKNILDFQILEERNGYAIIIVNTPCQDKISLTNFQL
jgi:hypothetical protein